MGVVDQVHLNAQEQLKNARGARVAKALKLASLVISVHVLILTLKEQAPVQEINLRC